ncbi:glycosyltransferase [Labrys sp. KNU-23]|uniref:glycosyltransferase n=1 Tax=Labrys sp. KNU-23 TaxID=2789216 RepID=UPI0011EC1650|nr:glycosyltransferase [Labrys sp. KNU-23]QEN85051.1 glycosyltransferase [Labrys sp. KNU-23]
MVRDTGHAWFSGTDVYSQAVRDECTDLVKRADNVETAQVALPRLKYLLSRFPGELDVNLSHALVAEMTRVREGMLELWTEVHEKFPDNYRALQYRLRWLSRHQRVAEGREILERHYPDLPCEEDRRLSKAELFVELREIDSAKALFVSALADFPASRNAPLLYARRLREWGELTEALAVLDRLLASGQAPRNALAMAQELRKGMEVLDRHAPDWRTCGMPARIVVLKAAIDLFRDRSVRPMAPGQLGSISLITGSLGTGGAERQLARTAARLERTRRESGSIAGRPIRGPVQVVVKSLSRRNNHDFFLPMIACEQVEAYQIDNMTPARPAELAAEDSDLRHLLPLVPAHATFGTQRLVEHFRRHGTDIAYIWQDGAVLFAALAALVAGVPRIVLNVRGLPPVLRPHLFRGEYEPMYRALAQIPGVEFMSNSHAAAKAYCDWLGLSPERFTIVHNGVEHLPPEPNETDEERWQKFDRRTAGATETIGGVFRIDVDKRPELWIDFVRAYHEARPNARFVLVGSGPLLPRVRQRAAELGIADRILFVGRSASVGYWLAKMDAFVLLSRFEGLPNVLIEAQLAGIPVVSTPAGGACETFSPGVTGLATDTVEAVDLEALCAKVGHVVDWRRSDPDLADRIRQIASERFSTTRMVKQTVKILAGSQPSASSKNMKKHRNVRIKSSIVKQ